MTKRNIILTITLASASCLSAQQPYQPVAPKPPQITAAKTVFLSNNLGASLGDSDKIYDEIYTGLQKTNRFTLVKNPAAADLILQFSLHDAPPFYVAVILTIIDPKTNVVLWSVSNTGEIRATAGKNAKKLSSGDVVDSVIDYLKTISTPNTEASK
jgi:hypothetical protein